ncbi:hypothetical protein D3C71_1630270 [compost metagenome]
MVFGGAVVARAGGHGQLLAVGQGEGVAHPQAGLVVGDQRRAHRLRGSHVLTRVVVCIGGFDAGGGAEFEVALQFNALVGALAGLRLDIGGV